jgi:hypothetical protein
LLVGWILLEQQARLVRQALLQPVSASAEPREPLISSWEVCATLLQSLRTMILGPWTCQQILDQVEHLRRLLICHPQQRGHQETYLLAQLTHLLAVLQG